MEDNYSHKNFRKIIRMIIIQIKKLRKKLNFNYVFCDTEVNIEYSLCEILEEKTPIYSIVAINHKNGLEVRLASWEIDGLTSRF